MFGLRNTNGATSVMNSSISRREFLATSSTLAVMANAGRTIADSASGQPFRVHAWQRDARNPVLPPSKSGFDVGCCMNPFALRQGDEYWLYYAGADKQNQRRICLATAPVGDLTNWTRHGPL